jgi:hypothetical protein
LEVDTDGDIKLSGAAASSSGHVKGGGKGGSKTGHWSNMEDTDMQQVDGSDTVPMLSIKDESESRKARIEALAEAVIACVDSSKEDVEKALERLAIIKAPQEKTKKGTGIGKVECSRNCGKKMKWSLMDNVQVSDVDGGVTFRLLSGAQIRPKGVLRVSRRMLTSTVRGFEEWQILEGTEWIPFEVNRQWLRFLTPQNQILDENTYIGYFQLEVSVFVSCEEVESWEEMATNVDLDDISTPRSRSSASSTR